MGFSKSKLYLTERMKKENVPQEFKNARWIDGEEEPLLSVIEAMFATKGLEKFDEEKAVKSDKGELLLYESTMSVTKKNKDGEDKVDKIPVQIFYNPNVQYNSYISGVAKNGEYKGGLRKLLIDHLVNYRFPVSRKVSDEAIVRGKPLKVLAGNLVWGRDTEEVDKWHCALPVRVEINESGKL